MLRAIAPILSCFGMLAVVACGGRDPVADGANNTAGLPTVNEPSPDVSGTPPTNAVAEGNAVAAPVSGKIPAALQGRWGLGANDCIPGRSDAKGLLTITGDELRFYESRAKPTSNVETDDDSMSGDFAFTGEGQSWTKFQALKLQGQDLVRTETNPSASFNYAKCT
ncbi:hypothetical protein [Sphingomonas hankyongi]|uniref:Uncharacterized protein n=1 Tax=Sphingomonas hankyongi TaxID=2908209 RepID=A0ABT0S178_9SPHN|nr:hypothetical protein [Sphingomonas hankyongi]MCL6729623.1 hypothetical protein [Sphingomonas hankyongi]